MSPDTLGVVPAPQYVAFHPSGASLRDVVVAHVSGDTDGRVAAGLLRLSKAYPTLSFHLTDKPAAARVEMTVARTPGTDTAPPDERYHLVVGNGRVAIRSPSPEGGLRALATLAQLGEVDASGVWQLPGCFIDDAPRFAWRGLMLDVARHFVPVVALERHLEAMALVKMNVFHWHLTDDQGFRLALRRHPELAEPSAATGVYTHDDVRRLVAFARARGIRVVPELDIPGHAHAWLLAVPEVGSLPGAVTKPAEQWGILDAALDPTSERTYALLDDIFAELAELFDDPVVHIGGDEVNGKHWRSNARIRGFMEKEKFADTSALQAHFVQRVTKLLAARGKRVAGWEEIAGPLLSPDALVQAWQPGGAARIGRFDTVLSGDFYLDGYPHVAALYAAVGPETKDAPQIQGGEACMWTELAEGEQIDMRIWPQTGAVAERLWSPASRRDVADLRPRLQRLSGRLEGLGLRHLEPPKGLAKMVEARYAEHWLPVAAVLEPWRRNWWRPWRRVDSRLDRLPDFLPSESVIGTDLMADVHASAQQPELYRTIAGRLTRLREHADHHAHRGAACTTSGTCEIAGHIAQICRIGEEAIALLERPMGQDDVRAFGMRAGAVMADAALPRDGVRIAILPAVGVLIDRAIERHGGDAP